MTWRIILVALAIAALLLPLPPPLVERYYSSTLFPVFQSTVTATSNLAQFAWFDVLLVVVIVPLLALSARDLLATRWPVALLRIVVRIATVGAVVYLVFLTTWGFNYRREPLRHKIAFDEKRITPGAALALAREAMMRANALHGRAHAEGWAGALVLDRDLAPILCRRHSHPRCDVPDPCGSTRNTACSICTSAAPAWPA